jgi:hypothetical protein
MPIEKALFSQLNVEDINELNTLLINLHKFLISRNVINFAEAISAFLSKIALVQTNSEKLCIINSRDTELLLRGGVESFNNLRICSFNDHISDSEQIDNQELAKYKDRLGELFTR